MVNMKDSKVLVVGSTGRVGGAAVEELLGAGFEVRALVRSAQKAQRLRKLGAKVAVGDVTQPRTLAPALHGCFGVFSALGAGPGRGSSEVVEYKGNLSLLPAARSSGIERFVYSSALMADHPQAQEVGPFREKGVRKYGPRPRRREARRVAGRSVGGGSDELECQGYGRATFDLLKARALAF
jgi:uncharacterized protein YbjT (DUF2867 family)